MKYNHILRTNRVNNMIFKQQELYLQTHGEFRGIIDKSNSTEFYYTLNGDAYRVLRWNDDVSVNKISIDEMNRLLACANLKFGD